MSFEVKQEFDETLKLSKSVGLDPDLRNILEKILIIVKKPQAPTLDLSELSKTVDSLSAKLDGLASDVGKIYKKLEEYEEPVELVEPESRPKPEERIVSFSVPITEEPKKKEDDKKKNNVRKKKV